MQNVLKVGDRNLVPLNKYTKPVLKLGRRDNMTIAELQKQNSFINNRIDAYESELVMPGLSNGRSKWLKGKIESLTDKVNDNNSTIRDIKKLAYERQLNFMA